jgi:hypothetical protein
MPDTIETIIKRNLHEVFGERVARKDERRSPNFGPKIAYSSITAARPVGAAQFTRDSLFETVVGEVKFGKGGGWSEARVLQVQYQNIKGADLSDFRDARTQAVVWPSSFASGTLIYPYAKAKRNV